MTDNAKYMFRNVAFAFAIIMFLIYAASEIYFFILKPMSNGGQEMATPTPIESRNGRGTPDSTRVPESVALFDSLSIDTNYVGYFPEADKCRQTYNQMFGTATGAFSDNSACNVTVTFNRNGTATKSLVIKKFDPANQSWKAVEKTERKGQVSGSDFEQLAAAIAGNEAFKIWNNGISVTTRNVSVTAKYSDGIVKTPMSNVDEKSTAFLPMIEAFKNLDAKTSWK